MVFAGDNNSQLQDERVKVNFAEPFETRKNWTSELLALKWIEKQWFVRSVILSLSLSQIQIPAEFIFIFSLKKSTKNLLRKQLWRNWKENDKDKLFKLLFRDYFLFSRYELQKR